MTSEGLGVMFEGDSAEMCDGKLLLVSMGGRAEGLAWADPGARTPIGASENLLLFYSEIYRWVGLISFSLKLLLLIIECKSCVSLCNSIHLIKFQSIKSITKELFHLTTLDIFE